MAFEANSSDAPSATPALKIGEVDTSGDTTTEVNREPHIDTANIDAETLDGHDSTYYAPIDSPAFSGTPGVYGDTSIFDIGGNGDVGPHKLRFGNDTGEPRGWAGYLTDVDEFAFGNDTANDLLTVPLDGSPPSIQGEEIQTVESGTTTAVVYVGDTAPSNPNDGDVWIDTGSN